MSEGGQRFPMRVKRGFATVTIYRRPHPKTRSGFVFTVSWTVGGQRHLLQRTSLAKAQTEAVMKVEQLASGLAGAGGMTSDDAATLKHARRLCHPIPVIAALEEWCEARKLCQGSILPAARAYSEKGQPSKMIAVPAAVKLFLRHKKSKGVDVSASYEQFLPRLAEAFPGAMGTVSSSMLETWIHREFRQGESKTAHPATFNTARKRLVTLWRWARNERFLPQDSVTEAERIHATKEKAPRRGIMGVQDFARALCMLQDDHPGYLAAAVLAGFCGLRRDEIHAQRWEHVNLKAAKLSVTAAKEGTPMDRLVEIPPAAVEWLMLCDRAEERVAPPWAQDLIRKYCREAKPPIPCPPNALRHSFVSYRVARSGNVAETALEAGNSAGVIFKNYRRPVSREDGEQWFSLTPSRARALVKPGASVGFSSARSV